MCFVNRLEMRRKLGLFIGSSFQQAFMIFITSGGRLRGTGIRNPLATFEIISSFVIPGYGILVGLNISHCKIPKLHTSEAWEKTLPVRLSGAIHLRGEGPWLWDTYTEDSLGTSRTRPKSATLHVSSSPTRTLRAAKSCKQTIMNPIMQKLWDSQATEGCSYPVDYAFFWQVVHAHCHIHHVLCQLSVISFIFLVRDRKSVV